MKEKENMGMWHTSFLVFDCVDTTDTLPEYVLFLQVDEEGIKLELEYLGDEVRAGVGSLTV